MRRAAMVLMLVRDDYIRTHWRWEVCARPFWRMTLGVHRATWADMISGTGALAD